MSTTGNAESYIELKGSLSMPDAITGKSAYEIAVMNGFDGTEEEWLESLKGKDGKDGEKGEKGERGEKGEKGEKGDSGSGEISEEDKQSILDSANEYTDNEITKVNEKIETLENEIDNGGGSGGSGGSRIFNLFYLKQDWETDRFTPEQLVDDDCIKEWFPGEMSIGLVPRNVGFFDDIMPRLRIESTIEEIYREALCVERYIQGVKYGDVEYGDMYFIMRFDLSSENDLVLKMPSMLEDGEWVSYNPAEVYVLPKAKETADKIGDIDTALDELHNYAQALVGGGA